MVKLHEYFSENKDRFATIYVEEGVLYVYCYEDGELVTTVNCIGRSEQYAEDAAENWVNRWGNFV